MGFTKKALTTLASALLVSGQFYADWEKQGQCYVTSRVYAVPAVSETTITNIGPASIGKESTVFGAGSPAVSETATPGFSTMASIGSISSSRSPSASIIGSSLGSSSDSTATHTGLSAISSSTSIDASSGSNLGSTAAESTVGSSVTVSSSASSSSSGISSSSSSSSSAPSTSDILGGLCPVEPVLSCSSTIGNADACCVEKPGGLVLSTQFWNYNPAIGPDDVFTLHGLWPDNCDGTYDQYCAPDLEISGPRNILNTFDPNLVAEMDRLWKTNSGSDETLWEHEFNKHATCMSTIKPDCYGDLYNTSNRVDVYDYFKLAVDTYMQLPTYEWLKSDGIIPSNDRTYASADVIASLESHFGATPYISCDKNGGLSEVWYFYHVAGSLRDPTMYQTDSTTKSNCPEQMKYPPKDGQSSSPTNTAPTTSATATPQYGTVEVVGQNGCLANNGAWTTAECGTFQFTQLSTGSYNLVSNNGPCTLNSGVLTCDSSVTRPFELNYDGSAISANGDTTFSSEQEPTDGSDQPVASGSGAIDFQLNFVKNPLVAVGGSVKGYVRLSDQPGCLIRNGRWYVSGTCATYTLSRTSESTVTLSNGSGSCGIASDGTFGCGLDEPLAFNYDPNTDVISTNPAEFSAAQVAAGTTQVPVSPGSGTVNFNLYFQGI